MFLGRMLLPMKTLVPGSSITVERGPERVDYYHVELDKHDVSLAKGAPSESFLETSYTGRFANLAERSARS